MLPHTRNSRRIALAAGLVILAGCSTPSAQTDVHDPYESVNRATHQFNKELDRSLLRPASQVYGTLVPTPVRTSLDNAGSNLGGPANVVNNVLQGDIESAVHNTSRFLLNTTLGVLGLFDVAESSFGLENRDTGFADTLAKWGAREGAYQELPVFGPSTERDTAGMVVDFITNPVGTLFGDDAEDADRVTTVTEILNYRYTFSDTVDGILYDSADSYAQLRLFYLDARRFGLGESADSIDPYEDLYDGLFDE